jgi:predicted oxidoreductase
MEEMLIEGFNSLCITTNQTSERLVIEMERIHQRIEQINREIITCHCDNTRIAYLHTCRAKLEREYDMLMYDVEKIDPSNPITRWSV